MKITIVDFYEYKGLYVGNLLLMQGPNIDCVDLATAISEFPNRIDSVVFVDADCDWVKDTHYVPKKLNEVIMKKEY